MEWRAGYFSESSMDVKRRLSIKPGSVTIRTLPPPS
jgi:hypothetical protein